MADEIRFDGLRALVVEDKQARQGYVATLKAHGFEVDEAMTVDDALYRIRRKHYHLAWIDLGLDEVNDPHGTEGKEISKFLSDIEDPTFRLIVTVVKDANEANRILNDFGAHYYITKDVLDRLSWDKHFSVIYKGIKEHAQFPNIGFDQVKETLMDQSGEDEFQRMANEVLGSGMGIVFYQELLSRISQHVWPAMPIGEVQGCWTKNENCLGTQIWSRAFGAMVKIEVSRLAGKASENTIRTFRKGPANVSLELMPESEFPF